MKNHLPTLALACAVSIVSPPPAQAADNIAPEGFTALFNGKDLTGWWGAGTEDPRKYLALSDDAFKAKREASMEDIRRHWRVDNGVLVNDGNGLYLTTGESFGNFELLVDSIKPLN